MKAVICTEYGPPEILQVREVVKPVPKDNEVLVKVLGASVNYGDLLARNFKAVSPQEFNMPYIFWILSKVFFGLQKPKITVLGSEFSGEVEAAGSSVTAYKPGDQIFGYLGQNMGAYAEYITLPENTVMALKPANLTHDEAAVIPMGAIMALFLLKKLNIQKGQKILIIGASGSIGSAAVQIAKNHFAAEVTGVCGTPRLEYVKALGADRVIDYTKEDFTQGNESYDFIFDILGKGSFSRSKAVLKPNGRYLYASFKLKQLVQMLWTSIIGSKKVICALAPGSLEDLNSVKELIEAGKLKTIIDKRFPLEQAAEAHRYVENGHKKGSVVITLARNS